MAENLDDDRCEQSIDEVINMSLFLNASFQITKAGQV
jgi:hypothetical protein